MTLALPSVNWLVSPSFSWGSTQIRVYSVCVEAAFMLGYLLLLWQIRRGRGDDEEAGDFMVYGFLGVLVGARLGHTLFYDFDKVAQDPVWALKIWTGGFASHGAALGLWGALFLFTRRRAIPLLEGSDRLVFSLALGAILIRIGNLFNSEIVGKPTDGTWGVRFASYDHEALAPLRHPTQLYEAALGIVVLLLLIFCDRYWGKEQRPRGALTGLLLVSYFSGRFLIEFLKEAQAGDQNWLLNMGQLLSIPFLLTGAVVLAKSFAQRKRAGWIVGGA